MLFRDILFTSLFVPFAEKTQKIESKACDIKHDLLKTILYEAYIPIEALVFFMGTSRFYKSELDSLVSDILAVKNSILKHPELVAHLFNLSSKNNKKLAKFLKTRQKIIDADDSNIFEDLIKSNLDKIMGCIDYLKDKKFVDPGNDEGYRNMIDRLYNGIYDNIDIQDAISKEKNEFYRNFKPLDKKTAKKTKIALSLGGSIVNLPDLLYFTSKIRSKDKEGIIRDWIKQIFDAIEALSIEISSKDLIDQKATVIEFIKGTGDFAAKDIAFDIKTFIYKILDLTQDEKEKYEKRQKENNKVLLDNVSNFKNETWIIKYNRQIKEDLVEYLMTLQPEDKKKLLDNFKSSSDKK